MSFPPNRSRPVPGTTWRCRAAPRPGVMTRPPVFPRVDAGKHRRTERGSRANRFTRLPIQFGRAAAVRPTDAPHCARCAERATGRGR